MDISNVLHYPVNASFALNLGIHAKQISRIAIDHVLRQAKKRGLFLMDLHVDDISHVLRQKSDVHEIRYSAGESQCSEPENKLDLDGKIPENWTTEVIGKRQRKAVFANGLMGTLRLHCAEQLRDTENENTVTEFYGARRSFSASVLFGETDVECLNIKLLSC